MCREQVYQNVPRTGKNISGEDNIIEIFKGEPPRLYADMTNLPYEERLKDIYLQPMS